MSSHLDALSSRNLLSDADGFVINTTHGEFVSPIEADLTDMLYAAAGMSSPASAVLLTVFVGSWIMQPIALVQTTMFFKYCGIRSDLLAALLISVILPLGVVASTTLVGRNAYSWIKVISLMCASLIFTLIKHVFPAANRIVELPIFGEARMSVLFSVLGHGIFMINMAEEVFWEIFALERKPYNLLNGSAGGLLTLLVIMYAKRYGFSVAESDDMYTRSIRANLTPLFIVAFTLWNIEFNAAYHPEKAIFYIVTANIVPLMAAFLGLHDWLEIRTIAALHAYILRISPIKVSSFVNATLFLGVPALESEIFRYLFSSLAAVATLAVLFEVSFRLITAKEHFDAPYGLTSRVSVDERHPEKYYRDEDENKHNSRILASDI